ncbi:DEAD/DEAH box helicase family protein (plasmid) [Halorussus salilacus]|nr:DEAD/DEAH box helicase family protein [Halorussus salilacus]USZ70001.1 DEAD/DEAH box helicase family protein [Halorussus salilacus]
MDVEAFHDAVEEYGRPVVTAEEVSRALDRSQAETDAALDALASGEGVERLDVSNDPVVWYPTDWAALADRERVVVFPKRRELVVDQPTQFTRAQLSQFAHLVDTTRDGGYMYEIRQEDVWGAPHDDFESLLGTVRDVLPERSPHLEEWLEGQWKRAHRFTLRTHEDGYVVLEAASEDLMGNVARQKLDDGQLRAPISDTESWVAEEAVAEVKRILYEAGYPVQDDRDLETGDPLDVSLNLDLRPYQREWVAEFVEKRSGVLVGPPGSGKTVAGMGVLDAVGGETLILVPSRELATQWRDELLAHTTLTDEQVGEYHGGTKQIRPVTVATYQTAGMDRHRMLFDEREWGLIVYDECQHIPSKVFRRSADLQSKHRLGLSVDGDTIVPFKRGESISLERIEDFATEHLGEEAGIAETEGIETLSVTDDGNVRWTEVNAVMRHSHGEEMYEVRAKNGRKVSITEDHSLMVFDGREGEIVSKKPRDLTRDDYLLQPTAGATEGGKDSVDVLRLLDEGYVLTEDDTPDSVYEPLYERDIGSSKDRYNWKSRGNLPLHVARDIGIDRKYIKGVYVRQREKYIPPRVPIADFARLVGLFVADGALDEHRVEFYATDAESKSEVEEFKRLVRSLHPEASINTISNGENCTTVRISGPLARIFENIGLSNGAREKSIPEIVLSNPSAYEPFVEGVVLGDGHLQKRSRNREMSIISTSSDVLAQGLNFILGSLGYVGGNYRRNSEVAVREREHDVVTNNLVRFNPKNREKQSRNGMVPFTEELKQSYDSIERIPRADRYKSESLSVIESGLSQRSRLNDDEVTTIVERAEADEYDWLADADVGMLEIDSVTQVESEEYVYDLSTEDENFLGNHLFCHNSATPVREDDREEDIFTLIGPPIGTDWDALFEAGYVQEPEVQIRYVPWDEETYRNEYGSAHGHERRQIAASNPAKIREIRHLLAEHPTSKALIFVEYLDQGEAIADELGVPFVSGEMRHARRELLLQEFKTGERDTLVVSRVGDEGIDLPDAELAIVASGLGGSRRQGAQRAGRTMRPTGNARMYVLATLGTTEEDFARQRMRHLSAKGVRVTERDAEAVTAPGDQ